MCRVHHSAATPPSCRRTAYQLGVKKTTDLHECLQSLNHMLRSQIDTKQYCCSWDIYCQRFAILSVVDKRGFSHTQKKEKQQQQNKTPDPPTPTKIIPEIYSKNKSIKDELAKLCFSFLKGLFHLEVFYIHARQEYSLVVRFSYVSLSKINNNFGLFSLLQKKHTRTETSNLKYILSHGICCIPNLHGFLVWWWLLLDEHENVTIIALFKFQVLTVFFFF